MSLEAGKRTPEYMSIEAYHSCVVNNSDLWSVKGAHPELAPTEDLERRFTQTDSAILAQYGKGH